MPASVWKGHLTFGLVSFPVALFSAARPVAIRFNLLHAKDSSRIKEVIYCRAEDQPVPRTDLVKGYEYEKDQFVIVEDEEIKKAAPKTAKVMEVLEFVKAGEVDPVYLESSYYLAPGEGGEKAYALFFEAMRQAQYYGLAKIAMHNREHIVVLRPGARGLLLHTMYFQDEIRQGSEFQTDTSQVKPKELELAKTLVESLAAPFEPGKYHDTYRENLNRMIEEKAQGRKVAATPEPVMAPVVDIMEALKRSLAQRKPPQPVEAGERKTAAAARAPSKKRARRAS